MFPFTKEMAYPAVDVSETDKEIVAKAELPGLEPEDVDISLRDDVLTIKGEKKFEEETKKDNFHRIERSYGSFSRQIILPAGVKEDQVKAKFEKGVLTITMLKSKESKAKKISIES
jgi:HSP20 family protein